MLTKLSRVALVACALAVLAMFAASTPIPHQRPIQLTAAANCTLNIPANPLTADGLATPYELQGCDEANADTSAFVQAAIIDPTGQISVYGPLVVNAGQKPPVAPVRPNIIPGSTVAIWFGFNGDNLTQGGAGAKPTLQIGGLGLSQCTNGYGDTVFGQFSYCNAQTFFQVANTMIGLGRLNIPALGKDRNGEPCPTVRSYKIVDQDPSDNVQTQYLTDGTQFVQNTAANRAKFPKFTVMSNPSDNRLLTSIVDPLIGCTPWTAPNLADPGTKVPALPLDELQAAATQSAPVAYVPLGDPMTLLNGNESPEKTNAYRDGVNQPHVATGATAGDDKSYCTNLAKIFPPFLKKNATAFKGRVSPDLAIGNTFYTWFASRFVATYETAFVRPCQAVTGIKDPISLTFTKGVATGVSYK